MSKVINDQPFELTYARFDPSEYRVQLIEKISKVKDLFRAKNINIESLELEVFESVATNYRDRCRFGIEHYENGELGYVMWENGSASVKVEQYPIASTIINQLMTQLLRKIEMSSNLSSGLKAVHFLTTTYREAIIVLIYDKTIDELWQLNCHILRNELIQENSNLRSISIIGRSKGVKYILGNDYVKEIFYLSNGLQLTYLQIENGFSNPNASVNMKALSWLCDVISGIQWKDSQGQISMLEMYCGNGNHTVALSSK